VTTETLSSPHGDQPPPRVRPSLPLLVVAIVLVAGALTVALVVRHDHGEERRRAQQAALDDVHVTVSTSVGSTSASTTGSGDTASGVRIQLFVTNAGRHAVVLGLPELSMSGLSQRGLAFGGETLAPGAQRTLDLDAAVTCPEAAVEHTSGLLVLPVTSSAGRRHDVHLVVDRDKSAEGSSVVDLVDMVNRLCHTLDVAHAIDDHVTVQSVGAELTAHVTLVNDGRSALSLSAFRFEDHRLSAVLVPPLPVTLASGAGAHFALRGSVRTCAAAPGTQGGTFDVTGQNEYGPGLATISDPGLDAALATFLAVVCP
jgi:hypothetical protein